MGSSHSLILIIIPFESKRGHTKVWQKHFLIERRGDFVLRWFCPTPMEGSGRLLWHGYALRRLDSLKRPVTLSVRLVTPLRLLDLENRNKNVSRLKSAEIN